MVVALLIAVLLIVSSPSTAEEITSEACLACHGNEGFASPSGHPLYTNTVAFNASVHGSLPCTICHAEITELPHPDRLKRVGLEPCATCHSDAVAAYQRSIHGEARTIGFGEAAGCSDCHGNVHAITPHTEATSPANWSRMAATCARCHAKIELAEKFQIPVVRPAEAYLQSVHAGGVAAGRHAAVCSDCHGSHGILAANDPQSSIYRTNVPATCGHCHTKVLAAYDASVHGKALARGVTDAPVCTDCHGEHRILGPTNKASPVFAANVPVETCGHCHADERLNAKYGLPSHKVTAFEDSYHGLALRAGKVTVANCSSCHGVHDILPATDPHSTINVKNLPATCGKCHPGAGTRFAIGSVHGSSNAVGTWAASWVRSIYLSLIALTIGGMFVHNALAFSRKVRRPQTGPPPVPPGQPERMIRPLRWQHGLTMASFSVLVYTGFALKYPESWWAAPLVYWEGPLGLRGLTHRVAAVVMIVALVWHVGHLCVSRRLRTCMVFGMLPSLHDAKVLFGTLAYYLRLRRTPPHSGTTFNYAEKAEYLAFMWGSAVMTVTGFTLWFANLTLQYLPGWVPDVATAVHFYEAILASLAIVVWHFYWVIFDPDVYPMDWTWWDGQPPNQRVLERLPEEHEDEAETEPGQQ
jgi:Ni,Fe-hydrogenase I cytochrome b subunit